MTLINAFASGIGAEGVFCGRGYRMGYAILVAYRLLSLLGITLALWSLNIWRAPGVGPA